jgi:N,N'-diacetyllegionaminate synthase
MKTEIIAEIAQGYEGNPTLAELLVKGAIIANADAIKIQLVFADELCIPTYPYYNLFKSLEMDEKIWLRLVDSVHQKGKRIYFDIYGEYSLELARKLGADGVKISTTDFYNIPLFKKAASSFDTLFISIGGIPIEDVDAMLQRCTLPKHITLMHGFQAEPTATEDNNLLRISSLRARFPGISIGFMDHSQGSMPEAFYLPLVALGLGVSCIEKHITLDYSLEIEDYISALSVDRFSEFVKIIRSIEIALGSAKLSLTDKEVEYKKRAGKVLVSTRALSKGTCIAETDIAMKRVETTGSDNYYKQAASVLGKILLAPLEKNAPIEQGLVE